MAVSHRCFIARDVVKSEARRRKREEDATQTVLWNPPGRQVEQAAPRLDQALSRLSRSARGGSVAIFRSKI
jgi:hypothetical protein